MANKTLNTRIQHKIDTAANWSQAENFSPLKGELIIYQKENNSKIKIGDGNTNVNNLPFITDILEERLQLLETLLANISYNAENNTYTFNANIATNGFLAENISTKPAEEASF